MIQQILDTYAQFFDWHMWKVVLTDPVSWGLILSLVLIEGLLSADNALVLAVLVRHLPEEQRKKALLYGMIGAYFFRFVFIGIGVYLVKFWFIKALGALYLAWLSISHFIKKEDDDIQEFNKNTLLVRLFGTFWATVITVEIMDVAFSVDSILAAFAVSSEVWVLLMGGMLGILVMRTVATVFVSLIDRIPELENTAFILIGIIAIKMGLSVFHIEISHYLFFAILIIAFAITFVIHFMRKNKTV
ncbi:membrane protein [Lysinibacillus sp. BF-4]|uniref:TerC family protein n=1 Tax=Lysinibacillus sp. BF-4 TaxID=1473546 RepID=UPI0005073C89|nr:TerC family protein [Lysinibacillus sp. BF-4]KFL42892.1 membrane protein [Lysinibacillus sp. BF-4]